MTWEGKTAMALEDPSQTIGRLAEYLMECECRFRRCDLSRTARQYLTN